MTSVKSPPCNFNVFLAFITISSAFKIIFAPLTSVAGYFYIKILLDVERFKIDLIIIIITLHLVPIAMQPSKAQDLDRV